MIKQAGLHESLAFIEARLAESTQIALVGLDRDFRIADYNRGFAQLLERSENLTGTELESLLLKQSRGLMAESSADKSLPQQLHFNSPGGTSITLQCWVQTTTTGYLMYAEQAILADSEVMRTISTMNNELAGLTRELNRKNRALQQSQDKLQSKNEEIEHFVSIIAHDFNSPLITISSFVGLLEQDLDSGDNDKIKSDLAYINGAVQQLKQLLDGLMKITGVDRLDSPAESICYTELIDVCLATLAGPLQQRGAYVTTDETSLTLTGDRLQLGQIWQNLIENAIKYMGDQSSPAIEIGVDDSQGEPEFYVRDNGIGIKPEHAERVFHLFTQIRGNNPGIGLGLALVKRIVEHHKGKIWVESEGKDKGSCIKFTLPDAVVHNEEAS